MADSKSKKSEPEEADLSVGARGVDPSSDEGKELAKKSASSSKKSEAVSDFSELKPSDERYDPYQDPAVTSSFLAEQVAVELAGDGKSPTLDSCREAYKERKKAEEES